MLGTFFYQSGILDKVIMNCVVSTSCQDIIALAQGKFKKRKIECIQLMEAAAPFMAFPENTERLQGEREREKN